MLKNVTVTLTEETAHWARKKAAEENTSVSKLIGKILESEMRRSDDYWKAFERWKEIGPIEGVNAAERFTREQAHDRRK